MRRTLGAAHDRAPAPDRQLVIVRVEDADRSVGWGECSALNEPTYTGESAARAFEVLSGSWSIDRGRFPMAAAAVEMAELDLKLRLAGRSLAEHLGGSVDAVAGGAVVGLGSVDEILAKVDAALGEGYRRVKLKIEPGAIVDAPAAVRSRHPHVELHVDANGSLAEDDVAPLVSLASEVGVDAIEQPFPVRRPDLAARLIELVGVPVVADEAVGSVADAERLLEAGALGGVSIKPARLGGLVSAVDLLAWCRDRGLPATAGGMLESGLGRHALAAVAGLPGFSLIGDLSPAGRWLATDPFPDVAFADGLIAIPQTPGIAPEPDLELLDHLTLATALITP